MSLGIALSDAAREGGPLSIWLLQIYISFTICIQILEMPCCFSGSGMQPITRYDTKMIN